MLSILQNHSLKPLHTFGCKAKTAYFTRASSLEDIREALEFAKQKQLAVLILGSGSNLLPMDNFTGLVIQIALLGIKITQENEEAVWLEVSAGENWHQLVSYCVEKNYAGLENLALIPGTVGAAPMQNIGAYGVEFESVCEKVCALDRLTYQVREFNHADCEFDYRSSVFKTQLKDRYVIFSVTLKLYKHKCPSIHYYALQQALTAKNITKPSIQDIYHLVIQIREKKLPDPKKIGNAGSFFKNPIILTQNFLSLQQKYPAIPSFSAQTGYTKIPAAWLIDQCGFKGKRIKDAGVHTEQALVLVNYGQASGQEILALAHEIQQTVKNTFGVDLIFEVNLIT